MKDEIRNRLVKIGGEIICMADEVIREADEKLMLVTIGEFERLRQTIEQRFNELLAEKSAMAKRRFGFSG